MRLLLIRHGQTGSNLAGSLDTAAPGAPLTALGRRQAAALPSVLAHERIDMIVSSQLTRALQTAQPLADARLLTTRTADGLREISAGALEMRSDVESREAYIDCAAAWMEGDLGRRMPGGTDGKDFVDRFESVIDAIGAEVGDGTAVLSTHGGAIRVFTALRALDAGVGREQAFRIMNTGAAILEGDFGRGLTLTGWSVQPLGGAHLAEAMAKDVTGTGERR